MQLTGKQIIDRGIIVNYTEAGIQQQGIDVRLAAVFEPTGAGMVPAQGKTQLPKSVPLDAPNGLYKLSPGYYEVELMEGVNMPDNAALTFKTRSSLVRCGAVVHSGQFDAGFNTDRAGCFIHVIRELTIERGARIAQAIVMESDRVTNTYDGQFQGDKQRQ